MAFTKIAASGISSSGSFALQNINSTGIITATSIVATTGTFSGNVSIAGTLTYEDVTNIDSVGIVTARTGVKVLAGGIDAVGVITASAGFSGNVSGNVNSTGVSTLTNLRVGTGGTTIFTDSAASRVAIGTNTFAESVDLDGTLLVKRDTGLARIRIRNNGTAESDYSSLNLKTNVADWSVYVNATSNYFRIFDVGAGAARIHIDSSGNTGIGTTNPQSRLHLSSGTSTQLLVSNTSSTMNSGDTMGTVDFTAGPSNTTNARVSGLVVGTNESGGDVVFETRPDGGSLSEKVRITSTGNLGIGTTNPITKIEIIDTSTNTYADNAGVNIGPLQIKTVNNSGIAGQTAAIRLSSSSNSGTQNAVSVIANISEANASNNASLAFQTRGSDGVVERLRITSTGNLGIGTTNPTTKLDVNGSVKVATASSITVGSAFIQNNAVGLGQTTTTGRNAGVGTATGTIIYNSTTGNIELYDGNGWKSSASEGQFIQATGGTISEYFSGGVKYRVHSFTGSDTFNVTYTSPTNNTVEYLVVAGGGGGGPDHGGGGGGGGFRTAIGFPVSSAPGSYTVTVGSGGAAAVNGSNSAFGPIISIGGGNSGNPSAAGANAGSGGSGGGGRGNGSSAWGLLGFGLNPLTPAPVIASFPTYTPGTTQGYPGGNSTGGVGEASGGGGGAGGAGRPNPAGDIGGAGGNGASSSISGTLVTYAGGGGGGTQYGTGGAGGSGGGAPAASGPGNSNPGPSATANTGGGGGGAGNGSVGGSGGSGIVIVRYQIGQQSVKATGGTVSYAGGKTIHTFTSSATFTVRDPSLTTVEYLVVGGGGAGGAFTSAGGGGAGGVRNSPSHPVSSSPGVYTVTVGSGGAGSDSQSSTTNGSPSIFDTVTSHGGGGGGGNSAPNSAGGPGGSGGGGAGEVAGAAGNGDRVTGTSTPAPGQGNSGGAGGPGALRRGGGGGGAGGAGVDGPTSGNGGPGSAFTISGTSVTYAGGGGGAGESQAPGSGGPGGGGNAGSSSPGVSGTINLGAGGGGAGRGPASSGGPFIGGNGGSGIVIIAYPS